MRTTLMIDDDVYLVARELAQVQKRTAGKVLSDLARQGIRSSAASPSSTQRSGIPLLPSRGSVITPHQIKELMDEEGI